MKSISSADANRHFSALLRAVSRGQRVTVTSRGKPVATISAAVPGDGAERLAAKRALLARLRAVPPAGARNWTRDQLYDNGKQATWPGSHSIPMYWPTPKARETRAVARPRANLSRACRGISS